MHRLASGCGQAVGRVEGVAFGLRGAGQGGEELCAGHGELLPDLLVGGDVLRECQSKRVCDEDRGRGVGHGKLGEVNG